MVEIIAIDGPASVGKSSIAKKISRYVDSPVLHSGILYRIVAYEIINQKINHNNKRKIIKFIKSITNQYPNSYNLYSNEIDEVSSLISAKKYVREELRKFQRNFPKKYAKNNKFAIIEGRDIGTVIFPDAKYKIFMWADAKVRAKRRYDQIKKKVRKSSIISIYREILKRDSKDLNRKIAPLKPAENSVLLDTTYLDIEQTFNAVKKIINQY